MNINILLFGALSQLFARDFYIENKFLKKCIRWQHNLSQFPPPRSGQGGMKFLKICSKGGNKCLKNKWGKAKGGGREFKIAKLGEGMNDSLQKQV